MEPLTQGILDDVVEMGARMGQATLAALYPKEFSVNLIALELQDYTGASIDYFAFPIMPSQLQYDFKPINNLKKTLGGLVNVSSDSFDPQDITISGDFGRNYKLISLSGGYLPSMGGSNFTNKVDGINTQNATMKPDWSMAYGGFDLRQKRGVNVLSPLVKSGFGCIKLLEGICAKSQQKTLDDRDVKNRVGDQYATSVLRPTRFILYNLAFGHIFQVKLVSLTISENQNESNLIPRYNLQLKVVRDLSTLIDRKKVLLKSTGQIGTQTITSTGNKALSTLQSRIPMK